jgi:hypothetical protein
MRREWLGLSVLMCMALSVVLAFDSVLLESVQELEFTSNQFTVARRVDPMPQLQVRFLVTLR